MKDTNGKPISEEEFMERIGHGVSMPNKTTRELAEEYASIRLECGDCECKSCSSKIKRLPQILTQLEKQIKEEQLTYLLSLDESVNIRYICKNMRDSLIK